MTTFPGWQPIETAPKNGDRIIVARFVGSHCSWVHDARWLNSRPLEGQGWHYENAARIHVLIIPTHWVPLRGLCNGPFEPVRAGYVSVAQVSHELLHDVKALEAWCSNLLREELLDGKTVIVRPLEPMP